MEHIVQQRSPEWFELRRKVFLTSSHFGDAVGLGKGRSYDYLVSLISDDEVYLRDDKDKHIKHGIAMEQTIQEIYQLLTGAQTRSTGFWTMKENIMSSDKLSKEFFGVSPDAIVLGKNYNPTCNLFNGDSLVGLVEFKAPVYQMYQGTDLLQGIPRYYMAQIQGQMFITGSPWCDFLAVCCKTKEILLRRVYFNEEYWSKISVVLKQFCTLFKEANQRKALSVASALDFQAARNLKFVPQRKSLFTGEDKIKIVDLLRKGKTPDTICGPSNIEYTFSMLIGEDYELPSCLSDYGQNLLNEVDIRIKSTTD